MIWVTLQTLYGLGYGDYAPQTSCGRSIAVLTAFLGVAWVLAGVAIAFDRLTWTPYQERMRFFLSGIRQREDLRVKAATLISRTFRIYLNQKHGFFVFDSHRRRWLDAIFDFHRLRKLALSSEARVKNLPWTRNITESLKGDTQQLIDYSNGRHQVLLHELENVKRQHALRRQQVRVGGSFICWLWLWGDRLRISFPALLS